MLILVSYIKQLVYPPLSLSLKMLSASLEHMTTQPYWILLVSSLGFLSFIKNIYSLLRWIVSVLLRPAKDLRSYGSWAVVTGSTDGIGRAFAFKLAEKGLNLVLVSRNLAKLNTVSAEIQARFPHTKIKLLELDFSRDDDVGSRVEEATKGVEIGVLINNVGVTYPRAMYFDSG